MDLPHWDALDRHRDGLRAYFRANVPPGGTWVGIDERTILLGRHNAWEVAGEGTVVVGRDGHETAYRHAEPVRLR